MSDVEVKQADVDAALKHLGWESHSDLLYWSTGNDIQRFDDLENAFARHRIEATRTADEEVARLGEELQQAIDNHRDWLALHKGRDAACLASLLGTIDPIARQALGEPK